MDGNRFDSLTRALGAGRSRRGVLKGLGAAALGAAGLSRLGEAEAAACRKPSTRCGKGKTAICTNLGSDVTNCGACGHVCSAVDACTEGICGCTPATTCAGGQNCSTASDGCGGTISCGTCTAPANASATCTSGTCGFTCNSGYQPDGNGGCAAICPDPSVNSTYGQTCNDALQTCTAQGITLSAQCADSSGYNYVSTSITVNSCQAQGYVISNCNGILTCGNC
jgi:hypothetical protein